MDASDPITCDVHGSAAGAYVCSHLLTQPVQRWHCSNPTPDRRWPDAWCDACETAFQREGGEWNERNEDETSISLICSQCYEDLKGRSVERLQDEELEKWHDFISTCQQELTNKQAILSSSYALGKYDRYDWNQHTGEIMFSNNGVRALIARVEFVGSISTTSNTWLWSWANFSLLENVRSVISKAREFGFDRDFPHLFVPLWSAEEVDGWEMTAVAAHLLDAQGAYRTPSKTGFLYMVLSEVRFVQ